MISCHLHDHIEIACMYRFSVALSLTNGQVVSGVAHDVVVNENKEECIVLVVGETGENKQPINVELSSLISMQALTSNPHFDLVRFDK